MAKNKAAEGQVTSRWYKSVSDYIYMAVIYIVLILALLLVLIPFIFILASSFSSAEAISAGKVLFWPVGFNVEGYKMILETSSVWRSFLMSLFYMVAGTLISLVLTILLAYPLTRKDFKANSFITVLMIITMFFSGGMIPSYLLIDRLNMLDTVWAILLPTALSAYNVVLVRTYMSSNIPKDLYECASLDGCSDFRYLVSIVIPLSKTIIAVMALLYGVGIWNNYFNAMMYIRDRNLYPFQLVLRDVLVLNMGMGNPSDIAEQQERLMFSYLLKYSTIVVGCLPVMIAYPFVQKYFVKGIMIGALKG
ncbi:MAG TPA: carbohydrate ABC transporter permease [Candidatus Merdivicinus intestinavium]|nr:carbohydrate ABC transporter permease [Candidatus Merdivicinus intestinavium]